MIHPSKIKNIKELIDSDYSHIFLIDVRCEKEFAEDHIHNAINLPVLSNEERSSVGTIYKENSFEARQLGARLIAKNLSWILEKIEKQISPMEKTQLPGKPKIEFNIYCWRGGMRSRSLFLVMDLIGYKVKLIEGGYKSYRNAVNDYFLKFNPYDFFTIYGPSGSGKTELIDLLEEKKFPVLPLEKFANHKGSILGGNFKDQPSQKMFESKIFFLFKDIRNANFKKYIVEGESRNIGKLSIPNNLFVKILSSDNLWIELPIEERAKRLADEYKDQSQNIIPKIILLKSSLSAKITEEVISSLKKNDLFNAAFLLLSQHYDHYYKKNSPENSKHRKYKEVFRAKNFETLSTDVLTYLENEYRKLGFVF